MTILWVDVSHHDWNRRGGDLDWAAVRSVTSPVMCARATYGDPSGFNRPSYHFADFQQGARAAGFTLQGGYHNLVRGDAAAMRRQVDWFRWTVDGQACDWAMVDIERYKELLETGNQPGWDDVRRWQDAWYAVDSRPMVWYLPRWVWSYWSYADLRELKGPLIQSHYLSGVYGSPSQIYAAGGGDSGTGWDDFYGNRYPEVWQYTATCDVAGASSQTDVNAFRGSLDELTALLTGGNMINEDWFNGMVWRVEALLNDFPTVQGGPTKGEVNKNHLALKALTEKVDALAVPPPASVDLDALVAKLAPVIKAQAAAAVSEVLGKLDGSTPA